MKIFEKIAPLRKTVQSVRLKKKTIGFVPTMGALHDGHRALLRQSKKENDVTVLSIFVNPTQFGPTEDYTKYPRTKKEDVLLAKKEGVDIILHPSVDEMYPEETQVFVDVKELGNVLCGRSRPGHFRGVATVVAKLLNIVTPDVLYLGQKDAQQCVVLKQMVSDLNFPVKVKIVPTVREKDGLAMSSRNRYLSPQERQEAAVLYQSLQLAKKKITAGERRSDEIRNLIERTIRNTSGHIDYVACVDANTLQPSPILAGPILIALAVRFGETRLIDNLLVEIK